MRIEDTRGGCIGQFPVGMRVLAVDDDLACLKLLEALLRRCRYYVTITDRASMALELLRENRDSFDLVISDVHMPDMDGFKLLELVGLEMDIPVIMLSGDGETKTVMKGITHGAVDYLLKPVRIEELRNIWQHAIRRRKLDKGCETRRNGDFEEGDGPDGVSNGMEERNGKLSRKRKDQVEEDGDYCEEGMNESEDPSTQKRPRVVWSIELHRKFVAAINHLGLEKAVPKRILDLMNVDGLTRENVASHLQKYRLYLRRLNAVSRQQASMVAALGGRDLPYIPMYSADSFGDFQGPTASDHTLALSPYKPNGVLNLTSPSTFGLQMLARSGLVQFGDDHNTTSPKMTDLDKLQYNSLPVNKHGNLIQMRVLPLELENFHQSKTIPVNNHLPVSSSECGVVTDSSISSFVGTKDIPLLLQANQQHMQYGKLSTDSSLGLPSMSSDLFEKSARNPSYSPNLGSCNGTWQVAVHLNDYTAKTLPLSAPSTRNDVSFSMMGACSSPISSNISSSTSIVAPQHDPTVVRDRQCQPSSGGRDSVLMSTSINEDPKFLNFRNACNSRQKWEKPKMNHASEPGLLLGSSLNSPLSRHPFLDSLPENQRLGSGLYNMTTNTSMVGPTDLSAPLLTRSFKADKSIFDGHQNYKDEFSFESSKLIGRNSNNCNLDDLLKAMIQTEQDNVNFIDGRVGYDGDMGYDIFPLGTCM